jgi:hypothetical protein
MRRIGIAAFFCLLALATSASAEEPKGFLEWPWGTAKETITKDFLLPRCGETSARLNYCSPYNVGDVETRVLFYFQPDDTLTGYYMKFHFRS